MLMELFYVRKGDQSDSQKPSLVWLYTLEKVTVKYSLSQHQGRVLFLLSKIST